MNAMNSLLNPSLGSSALGLADPLNQMPPVGSTVAADIDFAYMFIFWISAFFLVAITLVMVGFVIKYRRKDESEPFGTGPTHNMTLEVTWTVIPFILVCFMFYFGLDKYIAMATPPHDAYRVDVVAKQWSWEFTYPNPDGGGQVGGPELHAFVGQPFSLRMNSTDVLHAFYVPEMRVKRDIVPGRTDFTWFEPILAGEFWVFCTEYCGTSHSQMITKLYVHETRAEFDAALRKMGRLPVGEPWEKGLVIWERAGCKQCHSLDGGVATGPSWLYLSENWGKNRPLDDGSQVLVDDAYIKSSILKPASQVAADYQGVMPAAPRLLTDPAKPENIGYVTDLIEVLKDKQDLDWLQKLEEVKSRPSDNSADEQGK